MSRMHRDRLTTHASDDRNSAGDGARNDAQSRQTEMRRHERFRLLIQLLAAAFFNGYAAGFLKGKIFTGRTKLLCVPVLNCYACPGALGSCPIGAMQAVAGGRHRVSFYVLGTLMLFGTVCGRLLCGFLCPFGMIQDLLYRIPLPKLKIPRRIDKILRYLKYAVLVIFVLLMPVLTAGPLGGGDPWFCKYICPAGTLEGGIPLLLKNETLRQSAGFLFSWKCAVLIAVLLGAVLISRCFCRYLCPLGAAYALFNRFALYQMQLDSARCIGCAKCDAVCPMALDVRKELTGGECIRCGRCKAACPADAIGSGFQTGKIQNQTKSKS